MTKTCHRCGTDADGLLEVVSDGVLVVEPTCYRCANAADAPLEPFDTDDEEV